MTHTEAHRLISNPSAALASYFITRLDGTASLAVVFWRDMMLIGTFLMFLSLALIVVLSLNNAPTPLLVIAYFINWPYSVFIIVAVWRVSAKSRPLHRELTRAAALLWLILALII